MEAPREGAVAATATAVRSKKADQRYQRAYPYLQAFYKTGSSGGPLKRGGPVVPMLRRDKLELKSGGSGVGFQVQQLLSKEECKYYIEQTEKLGYESVDWEYVKSYRDCER